MKARAAANIKFGILLVSVLILLSLHCRNFTLSHGLDFEHYYVGGRMLLSGAGGQLYSPEAQYQFQAESFGRVGTMFNYPAAMALLYVPSAALSVNGGFLLWSVISFGVFGWCVFQLNSLLGVAEDPTFLALIALAYLPIEATIGAGQSDAILLLAYSLTFAALKRERPVVAGLALALGLLKFHLVLPFAFVMLLRKQWSFLRGFAIGTLGMLSVCVAICPRFFTIYPIFLVKMQSMSYGGFVPTLMPNVRGLLFLISGREAPIWLLATTAIGGLWWAARSWTELERGFATTLAVTIATSYHSYLPDLVILLIPLLVLSKLPTRWSSASMIVFCTVAVPVIPYLCQTSGRLSLMVLPIVLMSLLLCEDRELAHSS